MDDSETVWVEREYVGHGFRDDDLSRPRTERVLFDECDSARGIRVDIGREPVNRHPPAGYLQRADQLVAKSSARKMDEILGVGYDLKKCAHRGPRIGTSPALAPGVANDFRDVVAPRFPNVRTTQWPMPATGPTSNSPLPWPTS